MLESLTNRQLALAQKIGESPDGVSAQTLLSFLASGGEKISQATLSRDLTKLVKAGHITKKGHGPLTSYALTQNAKTLLPIDADKYFQKEADSRQVLTRFQFGIFELLDKTAIFSPRETRKLDELLTIYKTESSQLSPSILNKEWERVSVEFSWKSSAIEGNTYTLLETENLLREGLEAEGKKKEEATMILNHKSALTFVRENSDEFVKLRIPVIEHLHSILVGDLGITKSVRNTLVGITGTRYQPLDNQFQIHEALEKMCDIVNKKTSVFVKAILSILILSYIQPFEDGNKRTARLLGNAVLISGGGFPLSFRSVSVDEYKKAILLFYELNNIFLFKKIFLDQCKFAVENYFRSHLPVEVGAETVHRRNKKIKKP